MEKIDLSAGAQEIGEQTRKAMSDIDAKLARQFSIFGRAAQTNGFGFQIHIINKQLGEIEKNIETLKDIDNTEIRPELASLIEYDNRGIEKKWNWYARAQEVGMRNEYHFIYCYTSKFLHAVPSSLTTNQKNLELDEVAVFLKYIDVRLLDIIEMAETLLQPPH